MSYEGSDRKKRNAAILDKVNAGLDKTTDKLRSWWNGMSPQSQESREGAELEKEFGLNLESKPDRNEIKKQD